MPCRLGPVHEAIGAACRPPSRAEVYGSWWSRQSLRSCPVTGGQARCPGRDRVSVALTRLRPGRRGTDPVAGQPRARQHDAHHRAARSADGRQPTGQRSTRTWAGPAAMARRYSPRGFPPGRPSPMGFPRRSTFAPARASQRDPRRSGRPRLLWPGRRRSGCRRPATATRTDGETSPLDVVPRARRRLRPPGAPAEGCRGSLRNLDDIASSADCYSYPRQPQSRQFSQVPTVH